MRTAPTQDWGPIEVYKSWSNLTYKRLIQRLSPTLKKLDLAQCLSD